MLPRYSHRTRTWFVLAVATAALHPAPAWSQASADAYKTDARLNAPITLNLRDASFADVTKAISDGTKVDIGAGPAVADDKASLFVKERPARDVMADIARHFGCRWRAAAKGYVLEITSDQSTLEAALRSKLRERALAALDARMRAIQQLQGYGDDQIDARLKEVGSALANSELGKRERSALAEEQQVLRDFRQPGGRVGAAIFSGLTVLQRNELISGREVHIGELPANLAAEVHKAVSGQGSNKFATFSMSATTNGEKPELPTITNPDNLPPVGAGASLRILSGDDIGIGRGAQPNASLQLRISLSSIRGSEAQRQTIGTQWSTSVRPSGMEPVQRIEETNDPALNQQVEIRLATSGGDAGAVPGLSRAVQPSLGALAEQLHAQAGLDIVSDSFIRARVTPNLVTGKRSVLAVLNAVCDDLDYAWEKNGSTIRLRSNRFYDDRPAEAPDRCLKTLRNRAAAKEQATLDDFAALASSLKDPQIKSLDTYWDTYFAGQTVPRLGGMGRLFANRWDLRFWSTLTPLQRQPLLAGDILPVSRMTRGQAEAFVAALTANDDPIGAAMRQKQPEPTRQDVATGGFSLKAGVAHQFTAGTPSMEGVGGSSNAVAIMSIHTSDSRGGAGKAPELPSNIKPRIVGPDGNEMSLDQMQKQTLNSYMFSYYLAGSDKPAKTSPIMIPQSGKAKGG